MRLKHLCLFICASWISVASAQELKERQSEGVTSKKLSQSSLKQLNRLPVSDIREGGLHITGKGIIGLDQHVQEGDQAHLPNHFALVQTANTSLALSYQAFNGKGWEGKTQFLTDNKLSVGNPVVFSRPEKLNRLHHLELVAFGEEILQVTAENKKGKKLPAFSILGEASRVKQATSFLSEASSSAMSLIGIPGGRSAILAYENNWNTGGQKEGASYLVTFKTSKPDQPLQQPLGDKPLNQLHLSANLDGTALVAFNDGATHLHWIDPLGETIRETPEPAKEKLTLLKAYKPTRNRVLVISQSVGQNTTAVTVMNGEFDELQISTLAEHGITDFKALPFAGRTILAVYPGDSGLTATIIGKDGNEVESITLSDKPVAPSAFDLVKQLNGKVLVAFYNGSGESANWVELSYRP